MNIESGGHETDTATDADSVASTLIDTIHEIGYGFTDITGGNVIVSVQDVEISKPILRKIRKIIKEGGK